MHVERMIVALCCNTIRLSSLRVCYIYIPGHARGKHDRCSVLQYDTFKQFKSLLYLYLGMHVRSTSVALCRFLYSYIRHEPGPGHHIVLFWTLLLNHMLCCIRTSHASLPNCRRLLIEKCICLICGSTSQATVIMALCTMSAFSLCLLILVTPGRNHCFLLKN